MVPEVKFVMLSFLMFDYVSVSVHVNNFKPCKWYVSPRACTKKREVKKEDFVLRSESKNKRGDIYDAWSELVSLISRSLYYMLEGGWGGVFLKQYT